MYALRVLSLPTWTTLRGWAIAIVHGGLRRLAEERQGWQDGVLASASGHGVQTADDVACACVHDTLCRLAVTNLRTTRSSALHAPLAGRRSVNGKTGWATLLDLAIPASLGLTADGLLPLAGMASRGTVASDVTDQQSEAGQNCPAAEGASAGWPLRVSVERRRSGRFRRRHNPRR